MQPFRDNKEKLGLYIDKIDEYYALVINKHDRDFLEAYKHKMNKHKQELSMYKQIADEKANGILKDNKVSGLTN
jgi:hypothetical protein